MKNKITIISDLIPRELLRPGGLYRALDGTIYMLAFRKAENDYSHVFVNLSTGFITSGYTAKELPSAIRGKSLTPVTLPITLTIEII